MKNILTLVSVSLLCFWGANPGWAADWDQTYRQDVFVSGEDGYHTYRIPALVISENGTLLAFCEGRKSSCREKISIVEMAR